MTKFILSFFCFLFFVFFLSGCGDFFDNKTGNRSHLVSDDTSCDVNLLYVYNKERNFKYNIFYYPGIGKHIEDNVDGDRFIAPCDGSYTISKRVSIKNIKPNSYVVLSIVVNLPIEESTEDISEYPAFNDAVLDSPYYTYEFLLFGSEDTIHYSLTENIPLLKGDTVIAFFNVVNSEDVVSFEDNRYNRSFLGFSVSNVD